MAQAVLRYPKRHLVAFALAAFALLAALVLGISPAQTSAQDSAKNPYGDRPAELDLVNAYAPPMAYVDHVDAQATNTGLKGTFTVLNQDDTILSDLQYRVSIYGYMPGDEETQKPTMLFAEPKPSALPAVLPGQHADIAFAVDLPNLPEGNYMAKVQLLQTGGRQLGWGDFSFQLTSGASSFAYLNSTQILLPEFGSQPFEPLTGPNVDPAGKISFVAETQLQGKTGRTLTPVVVLYAFDSSRAAVAEVRYDAVHLEPGVQNMLQLPFTAPNAPGVYMAQMTLQDGKKTVSSLGEYRIVVRGMSADLISARLASLATKAGESAFAKIEFVGPADAETRGEGQMTVELKDDKGVVSSLEIPSVRLTDGAGRGTARLVLNRDLGANPALHIVIRQGDTVLRDATVPVTLTAEQLAAASAMPTWHLWAQWLMRFYYLVWAAGILACLGLCIRFVRASVRTVRSAKRPLQAGLAAWLLFAMFFTQVQSTFAYGGSNGIEVSTPISVAANEVFFSGAALTTYRNYWAPVYSQPVVALFVNKPIHNGTYDCRAPIPFEVQINYVACNNMPSGGRVLVRYDRNGNLQNTFDGVSANWETVYDQTYFQSPSCGASACVHTTVMSSNIVLPNLSPTATQTTIQVLVKHDGYSDGTHPFPDSSFSTGDIYIARHFAQAFNVWINCLIHGDVTVTKTAATPVVQRGNQAIFTLTVRNNGPYSVANVTLTDHVPAGLTFVSSSDNRCSLVGSSVNCSFGTMTSSQQIPLTFTYGTSVSTACSTIPNVATVATTTQDDNPGNNQSSASVVVQCPAPTTDIQVTKTANAATVQQGSQVSYTLNVRNNGPDSASSVTLTDPVPTGFTFVSSSDNRCSLVGSSVNCNFGTMTSGQQIPVTFTYGTSASTACSTIPNVATVATTTQETNTSNNQSTANVVVQCPVPQADIQVTKTANTPVIQQGNTTGSFTVTVKNNGPDSAQNVVMTDQDPNLTFVSVSDNRCTHAGTTVTCNFGTMTSGQQIPVTLTYQITATTQCATYPNTATVSTTTAGDNSANNTSSASLQVQCPTNVDVQVVKTTTTPTIQQGNTATFNLTVTNNGPASAQNVVLTDTVPAGFTYIGPSDSRCTLASGVITCAIGTLASGQSASPNFQFVFQTSASTSCTTIPNTATVATSSTDSNSSNNQSTANVVVQCPVPQADIQVTKTANTPVIQQGNTTGSFTVTVKNNGPDSAQNVVMTDQDPNLTFVSVSDNRCTHAGTTVTCNFGTMTSGQQIPVTLTYQITATTQCATYPNTATVSTTTAGDNSANNTSSASLQVQCQQLGCVDVVKEIFDANGTAITTTVPAFSFQIDGGQAIQNDATGRARFVNVPAGTHTITENPLSGWTQFLVTPANGVVNVQTGSACSTVTFKNQQQPTTGCIDITKTTLTPQGTVLTPVTQFTFQLDGNLTTTNDSNGRARFNNVSAGTHTISEIIPSGWTRTALVPANGVVTVTPSANNSSCAQVAITNQQNQLTTTTDLSIQKTGPSTIQRGSTLSYQLTVTNSGPASAQSVQVSDPFSSLLTYLPGSSDTRCTQQGQVIVCQLGTMASGQQITLPLTFQSQIQSGTCSTATITNVATVSSATSETNMSNNTSQTVTTQLTCSNTVSQCEDVSIDVKGDPDPVAIGDEIDYRIRLRNDSNTSRTTTVRAFLDNDTRFEDASDNGDDVEDDEVEWRNVRVDADDTETLDLTVSVMPSARNGDRLRLRVETDCNDETEETRVIDLARPVTTARMTIDKTVDRSEAQPGDVVSYTVTIRNTGTVGVTGVNIDDVYTSGQLTILDAAGGIVQGNSIHWTIDRFDANTTRTLRYTARIGASMRNGDVLPNTVTLTAPGQNASDSAIVRIIQQLPQTGVHSLGLPSGGVSAFLRPATSHSTSGENGVPLFAWLSVMISGLGAGGLAGRKFLI